jgi:hypothetical protein
VARTGRKDFRQLRVDHRCPPDALVAVPKGLQISSVGDQGKKEAAPPPGPHIFSQGRSFRRQGGGPATSTGTFPAPLSRLALQFKITIAPAASPAPRTERTSQKGRPSQKRMCSNRLVFEIVLDQKRKPECTRDRCPGRGPYQRQKSYDGCSHHACHRK